MFKKKKSDVSSGVETKTPQKELTPKQKKRRNRRLFRLLVLALLVGFGWAGYDNLKTKSKTQIPTKTENPFTIQSADTIPVAPLVSDASDTKKTSVVFRNDELKSETKKNDTEVLAVEEADTLTEATKTPPQEPEYTDPIAEEIPEHSAQEVTQPSSTQEAHHYTLRDALTFRDNFLSEKPCGDDFRKLILSDTKTEAVQAVIKDTSHFCLTTNNVYGELSEAFLTAKQNTLIHYYYLEDNEWMAKIKSAVTQLIKIRNLNPQTNDVPAILDRAHNAIEAKNIALTTELIASLPQNLQHDFDMFLEQAQNYTNASSSLERLILSYAKGE